MKYKVIIKKKAIKGILKLPVNVQKRMGLLVEWVACWRMEDGTIEIEVYYAGSRENAPY